MLTKAFSRVSVFLAVFLLCSAASYAAATQTTITYYMATGQEDWAAWTRETAKLFEAERPDIQVEVVLGNFDKLLTMVSSGVSPDIIHIDGGSLPVYAERDLLLPLNSFIQADRFNTGKYFPALFETTKWKNEVYALPRAWGAVALVYNKDIFGAAGVTNPTVDWTWDNLVLSGKKLTRDSDGDGRPNVFGFMDAWANGNRFPIWIWQAGGDVWNSDFSEVLIDSEASLQGLRFYDELYHMHHIAPNTVGGVPYNEPGISTGNQDQLFRTGKVGMVHATRYFTPDEVSWDVAPLAKGPAGRHTMLIPSVAGISPTAANPEAAWAFLKFFASDEGYTAGDNLKPMRPTYQGAIPPTIKLAQERLSQRSDINELAWVEAAAQGRVNNLNNPFSAINGRGDVATILNSVAKGEIPLESSLKELAEKWRRIRAAEAEL